MPNPNIKLILTLTQVLTLKQPIKCGLESEDRPKCPHFPRMSSLRKVQAQSYSHKEQAHTLKYIQP